MKMKVLLFFSVLVVALTGCTNKEEKTFQTLTPNPEYMIVVKRAPNNFLSSVVVQGDDLKRIAEEINSSRQTNAIKSCPASLEVSYDVLVHYSTNDSKDRTFTVFTCPGTTDNAIGGTIDPGISYESLAKLFKQE